MQRRIVAPHAYTTVTGKGFRPNLIYTTGTETLSVGVYYLSNFGNEPLTAALSIVQTVRLLLYVVLVRRLAGREALTA